LRSEEWLDNLLALPSSHQTEGADADADAAVTIGSYRTRARRSTVEAPSKAAIQSDPAGDVDISRSPSPTESLLHFSLERACHRLMEGWASLELGLSHYAVTARMRCSGSW